MRIAENLSGRVFGLWNVLELDTEKSNCKGKTYWKCRCKCGRVSSVRSDALKSGRSLMCKHCMSLIDLRGRTFGDWEVIEQSHKDPHKWVCRCRKCGNIYEVHGSNLRSGKTTGCLKCRGDKLAKHHMSGKRIYCIWRHIKDRCQNSNSDCFQNYGGRGVSVCEEWDNSFSAFYEWSITHGYKENLTIDRIDVNGNYTPENCRWCSMKEQLQNQRRTIRVTYKGMTASLKHVCDTFGLNYGTIQSRMKLGMSFEEAVSHKKWAKRPRAVLNSLAIQRQAKSS